MGLDYITVLLLHTAIKKRVRLSAGLVIWNLSLGERSLFHLALLKKILESNLRRDQVFLEGLKS